MKRGNKTTRQIIAAMVVTTALCADHMSAAAPHAIPHRQARQSTQGLVQRLTQNLRRSVGDQLPGYLARCSLSSRVVMPTISWLDTLPARVHQPLSPFEFRLPPPQA